MRTGPYRLRSFRAARGLSRRALGARLGVTASMVRQLEDGTKAPGLALACAIARVTDTWADGAITPFEWLEAAAAEDRAA